MANFKDYVDAFNSLKAKVVGYPTAQQLEAMYGYAYYICADCPEHRDYAVSGPKSITAIVKKNCHARMGNDKYKDYDYDTLYWKCLLLEAQNHQVDSGLLYLERNREAKEKFYLPRREVFMKYGIVQGLQDLIDDKIDFLSVSLPPGTGKTTIEIFFLALVGGWWENDYNLSSAHSSIMTRSLYDGIQEILDDDIEYAWHEIFPDTKVQSTNAKETTINLGRPGRFKTWTMRSIDGSLTGATRCKRFLTADDMVSGIEEALNKNRLETLWGKVVNDLRSRRLDGCKEIYFATRWSVHDPIGKMQKIYQNSDRARFIAVPALNKYGESNFNYKYNGFSTKYFTDIKESMDELSFNCLYQQMPMEREGLLFPPDRLRRFYAKKEQVPQDEAFYTVFPDKHPDAIWAVCDTKDKGTDYEALPVLYQFGTDFYFVDCVFDDTTDYGTLDKRTASILIKHSPHRVRFESNVAGGRIAATIQEMIADKCPVTIETKYTTENKETKILVNSEWIINHVLFLSPTLYSVRSDYGRFMANLTSYTTRARVPHDDAPDSLAMAAEFVRTQYVEDEETEIISSPF